MREINAKFPGSCGDNAWNAIPATERLFAAARKAKIPVIYTTGSLRNNRIHSTNRSTSERAVTNNDWDIKDEFAPHDGDLVIRKERASGFFGTPLVAYLQMMGIDSLITCGESTSGCVRASVLDGCTNRYRMIVVEEGVFDRHEAAHAINLFDMNQKYADVLPLAEVLEYLGEVGAKHAAKN